MARTATILPPGVFLTRAQAQEKQSPVFNVGKVCKFHGPSVFYTSTQECRRCRKLSEEKAARKRMLPPGYVEFTVFARSAADQALIREFADFLIKREKP